jgi:hypothetical protein
MNRSRNRKRASCTERDHYAKQNNLQLGDALSQTQINALTQPMLWYVEQIRA